jgi:Bacteroidetes-specific putative membrane protein
MNLMRSFVGRIFCAVTFSLISLNLYSQQDPQNSQYMFTPYLYNPGATGVDDLAHVYGLGRLHQLGAESEGCMTSAGFNFPFTLLKVKNGFGILVTDDKFAFSKNLTIKGNYALQFKLDDKGNQLGVGVGFGVINGVFDKSSGSNVTTKLDYLSEGKFTSTSFELGLGFYFTSNRLYSGISIDHLTSPTVPIGASAAKLKPTLSVTSGYMLPIADSKFSFLPSFLLQTEFVATHLAVSGLFDYDQKFWIGGGYRVSDGVTALAGFRLFKRLQVGYSYDYLTSKLGNYSDGSHEVFLKYSFSLKRDKTPASYRSIRFL